MSVKEILLKLPGTHPILIVIAAAAILILAMTKTEPGWCNDTARLAMAESIVERSTVSIDDSFYSYTCDKLMIDGKFHPAQEPVVALYISALYWVMFNLFGIQMRMHPQETYYVFSIFSGGIPALILLTYLYKLLRKFEVNERTASILTSAAFFPTIIFTYSLVITNHIPSAMFTVAAYYYYYCNRYLLTGFLASMAITTDLTAFLILAPLLIDKNFTKMIVGGIPVLLLYIGWNYTISGGVIPFKLNYEFWQFEGSILGKEKLETEGIAHQSVWGYVVYLFNSTFGTRGLFIYSPIAVLGLVGLFRRRKMFFQIILGLMFYKIMTTLFSSNYSGGAWGIRWDVFAVPFLVFASYPLFQNPTRFLKIVAPLLFLAGFVLSMIGSIDPWVGSLDGDSSLKAQLSSEEKYLRFIYNHGIDHYDKGRYTFAEKRFEELLRRQPGFKPAIKAIARVRMDREEKTGLPAQ